MKSTPKTMTQVPILMVSSAGTVGNAEGQYTTMSIPKKMNTAPAIMYVTCVNLPIFITKFVVFYDPVQYL